MKRLAIGLATFLSAALIPSGHAAAQTAAPTGTPTVWNLGWQDSHCTISTGSVESLRLSLWMTPGDPDPQLYLFGPGDRLDGLRGNFAVTAVPGSKTFHPLLERGSGGGKRVLRLLKLGHEFPAAFSQASELRVTDGKSAIAVPIPGAAKAMAALKGCINEALVEWGIDAKAWSALITPPTPIENRLWLSADDYPSDAIAASWSGDVITRLNIDAKGKVTDCAVVVSSGMPSVDAITCRRAVEKARFNPAVGADGTPTAGARVLRVVYRMS